MEDVNRNEMNALLELIKRHAEVVSNKKLIEDIDAMQSKLEDRTKKAVSAEPEQ